MHRALRAAHRWMLYGSVAVAAGVAGFPDPALAQAGLTHTQNAAPVPHGMVRISVVPSWRRYDSRFTGTGGTEPLGAVLTSDALGTSQLPALTGLEGALRALTGDAGLRLSLGRALATSSVRVVTTPASLEYGVSRRLSVGLMVPIIQRQRELILDIETSDSLRTGNVGPVGTTVRSTMYSQAGRLAAELDAAAAALAQRVAQCTAQPAAAGCAAVTADPGRAASTVIAARQVAASVRYVYGTSADTPGLGLIPHTTLTAAINARLQALNASFVTFLGSAQLSAPRAPAEALGVATAENVRTLSRRGQAGIGPDSLGRVAKLGIGDVELSARYLAWDTRSSLRDADTLTLRGTRTRVLLGAVARFGSGAPARDDELFVGGAGDGQTDAEASVAIDIEGSRRLGATLLAQYTVQFGAVPATRLPDERGSLTPFGATASGSRTLGNILAVELSPRYRVGNALHVSGHYAMISRGGDTYTFPSTETLDPAAFPTSVPALPTSASAGGYREQRAGLGVTYSTVEGWERGKVRLPVEVSFTHLETFSGSSAMVPRAGYDQIQLRLYYRLRR